MVFFNFGFRVLNFLKNLFAIRKPMLVGGQLSKTLLLFVLHLLLLLFLCCIFWNCRGSLRSYETFENEFAIRISNTKS